MSKFTRLPNRRFAVDITVTRGDDGYGYVAWACPRKGQRCGRGESRVRPGRAVANALHELATKIDAPRSR